MHSASVLESHRGNARDGGDQLEVIFVEAAGCVASIEIDAAGYFLEHDQRHAQQRAHLAIDQALYLGQTIRAGDVSSQNRETFFHDLTRNGAADGDWQHGVGNTMAREDRGERLVAFAIQ